MRKRAPQGSRRRERSYPYLAWREGKVAGPSDEVSISRGGSVSTCNEAGEEVENLTEGERGIVARIKDIVRYGIIPPPVDVSTLLTVVVFGANRRRRKKKGREGLHRISQCYIPS